MKKVLLLILLLSLTLVACKKTDDPDDSVKETIEQAIEIIESISPLNALVIEENTNTEKVRVVTNTLKSNASLNVLSVNIGVTLLSETSFNVTVSKQDQSQSVTIEVDGFIVETVDYESIVDEAIVKIEDANTFPTIEVTEESEAAFIQGIVDYLLGLSGMSELRVNIDVVFNPDHWNYSVTVTRGDVSKTTDFDGGFFKVVKPVIDPVLYEMIDAVRNHFGDNYYPTAPIGELQLNEMYGIESAWMIDFYAEGPMWTMAVDEMIGISVKEGHLDDVINALNDYRDYLINDSFQYPMNMPKVEASKIHVVGNYVFFILLSAAFDGEDADAKAFYQSINQTAIDLINATFNE